MTTPIDQPVCMECYHRNEMDFRKISCAAYPNGVPSDIGLEAAPHDTIREDQQGKLTFTPK